MKRVLLDTNIVIHREASTVVRQDIGVLFKWLDRLNFEKCVHPLTIREIQKHKDPRVVASFSAKLGNYVELKTEAPETHQITALRQNDKDENSRNDTSVLGRVLKLYKQGKWCSRRNGITSKLSVGGAQAGPCYKSHRFLNTRRKNLLP